MAAPRPGVVVGLEPVQPDLKRRRPEPEEVGAAAARPVGTSINSSRNPDVFKVSTSPDPPPVAAAVADGEDDAPEIHELTKKQNFGLSIADTIHDAWGGYRNKEPALEDIINPALADIIEARWGPSGALLGASATKKMGTYLSSNLDDKVLISNIEDSTIAYFEKHSDFIRPRAPDAVITYDNIIAMVDPEGTAYGLRQTNDTYVITVDKQDVDSVIKSFANKDKVDRFILKFLLNTTEADIYMTFDAAPMAVGKLFRDHANVSGLIMPQNIGDSATTSFKQLGRGVDLYKFPITKDGRFVGQRNMLSDRELITYYEDEGFGKTFPFNFRYGLQNVLPGGADGPAHAYMSYKNGYTQGPSLDYLLELMLQAQEADAKFTRVVPTTACLRIGDAIEKNPVIKKIVKDTKGAVFIDMKRGGDQDACDAAFAVMQEFLRSGKYVILVTLDRLCSLLARLLGIPCILHHGDTLTLFKNSLSDRDLTLEQKAAFYANKVSNFVTQYMGLYNIFSNPNALKNLATFMCSIRDQISIEDAPGPAGKKTKRVELLYLKPLLRNRFVDIYNYLKGFALLWPKRGFPSIPAASSMTAKKETIDALIALFGDSGYDQNFLLEISVILNTSQRFDPRKEYPFLRYSYKQYAALETPLKDFMLIKGRAKALRDPENYEAILNREGGFNSLLTGFTSTFLDKAAGILAQEAYLFRGAAQADTDMIAAYERDSLVVSRLVGNTDKEQRLRAAFKATKAAAVIASQNIRVALTNNSVAMTAFPTPDPDLAITCQRGGAVVQKGGAFIMRNEYLLLKDICEEANIFMNREVGRVYPKLLLKVAIDQLIEHLQLTDPLLQEHNSEIRSNSFAFAINAVHDAAGVHEEDEEEHGAVGIDEEDGGLALHGAVGAEGVDEEDGGLALHEDGAVGIDEEGGGLALHGADGAVRVDEEMGVGEAGGDGDDEEDEVDNYVEDGGVEYPTEEVVAAANSIDIYCKDYLTILKSITFSVDKTLTNMLGELEAGLEDDDEHDDKVAEFVREHNEDINIYVGHLHSVPALSALGDPLYAPEGTTRATASAAERSHSDAISATIAALPVGAAAPVMHIPLIDFIRMASYYINICDSEYTAGLAGDSFAEYKRTLHQREPLLNPNEILFITDEARAAKITEIEAAAKGAATAVPVRDAESNFRGKVKPVIDTLQYWVDTNIAAHIFDIDLDTVLKRISSADASATLNKLHTKLIGSNVFGFLSTTRNFLNTVLSPYKTEAPPVIKIGYPLLYARPDGSPSPGSGAAFAAKLAADNASLEYILDRPVMYGLTMLSCLHDIFVGNIKNKTSLLISTLGPLPAAIARFTVDTDAKYRNLTDLMFSILKQIEGQAIEPAVLALFAGGARKTRRRRRRGAARRTRRAK